MVTEGMTAALPQDALAEIREVVGRAKRGDAAAVPRLRQLLAGSPALWEKYGDLAAQVEGAWVGLAAGCDLYAKESMLRHTAKLRAELTRPAASRMEKLLVERAVATWLQVNYFSGVEANAVAGDASPRVLQWRAKRQAQATRQHERALGALVAFQKLHPLAPARDAVPLPASAGVAAVAADQGQPFAPPAVTADETEEFDSTPGLRPAERVRVGVSG